MDGCWEVLVNEKPMNVVCKTKRRWNQARKQVGVSVFMSVCRWYYNRLWTCLWAWVLLSALDSQYILTCGKCLQRSEYLYTLNNMGWKGLPSTHKVTNPLSILITSTVIKNTKRWTCIVSHRCMNVCQCTEVAVNWCMDIYRHSGISKMNFVSNIFVKCLTRFFCDKRACLIVLWNLSACNHRNIFLSPGKTWAHSSQTIFLTIIVL